MTASEYKIHFLSAAGDLRAVIVDFDALRLVREVDNLGDLAITLRGDHPALESLERRSLVEVWRRDREHALDWTCEARCLYQGYAHSTAELGKAVVRCVDPLWYLSTRIVAWDVGVADRTIFARPASEIINLLVQYNATAAATVAAGRLREGNIPAVTLQNTAYPSAVVGWECAYENLLATIRKLAPLGQVDFYMAYLGGGAWEFRLRQDQLGTDRSAALRFSLDLANMVDPLYTLDRRQEKTVAIVGGLIVRGNRAYRVRAGADYIGSTDPIPNDSELWVPAPGVLDSASMDAAADAALFSHRKVDRLEFNLLQTPAAFYGVDYFLGDKVTATYSGIDRVVQLKKLTIDAAPTGEHSLVVSCG